MRSSNSKKKGIFSNARDCLNKTLRQKHLNKLIAHKRLWMMSTKNEPLGVIDIDKLETDFNEAYVKNNLEKLNENLKLIVRLTIEMSEISTIWPEFKKKTIFEKLVYLVQSNSNIQLKIYCLWALTNIFINDDNAFHIQNCYCAGVIMTNLNQIWEVFYVQKKGVLINCDAT